MKGRIIALGMFVLGCASYAQSLRCYDCTAIESSSSYSILNSLSIDSDPGCKDPGILTNSKECDYGDVCGYGDVTITASLWLLGSVTFKVMTRGCVDTFDIPGCYTADDEVKKLVNGLLTGFLSSEVDGKVCFCDEDLCESYCGDGSVLLGENFCVENWVLAVSIVAGIVVIATIIGCMCACCFSTSKRSRGTVLSANNNAVSPIVVTNQSSQMAAAQPPAAYPQAPPYQQGGQPQAPPQPYYQGGQPQAPPPAYPAGPLPGQAAPPAYPTGSHPQAAPQAYTPGAQEKTPLPPNPQGAQPQAGPPAYPAGTQPSAGQPQAGPPAAQQPPPPPATYSGNA